MPKRTNNPYTDEAIDPFNLPKESDCPYKAVGDCLIIIPMEALDSQPTSLIIQPGLMATDASKLRSRLLKGKIISVGEGVVGFEHFILPERPTIGDIVYFEAHLMKALPFGYGLIKYESCLFCLDDDKEQAKKILEDDQLRAKQRGEDGLRVKHAEGLGVGNKF